MQTSNSNAIDGRKICDWFLFFCAFDNKKNLKHPKHSSNHVLARCHKILFLFLLPFFLFDGYFTINQMSRFLEGLKNVGV